MTISDVSMIVAVIAGPILAIQAQKIIEMLKERRERKVWVFTTLMATRGTPVSPVHVRALNMIDLEFSARNRPECSVIDAWKVYLDHLNDAPRDFQDPNYQAQYTLWSKKLPDCLTELLFVMSQALGYTFDKVQLKKGAYTPQGHADLEFEQSMLRRGALDVIYGQRALRIEVIQPPQLGK